MPLPKPNLLSLPDELLSLILSHSLPSKPPSPPSEYTHRTFSKTNALSALLVCKRLHRIGDEALCKQNDFKFTISGSTVRFDGIYGYYIPTDYAFRDAWGSARSLPLEQVFPARRLYFLRSVHVVFLCPYCAGAKQGEGGDGEMVLHASFLKLGLVLSRCPNLRELTWNCGWCANGPHFRVEEEGGRGRRRRDSNEEIEACVKRVAAVSGFGRRIEAKERVFGG